MCSAARAEACAAAARLVAIGELVALRLTQDGGASEDWTLDAVDAATIEVSAGLGISRGLAASHVRYAQPSHPTAGAGAGVPAPGTWTRRRFGRRCFAPG